MALPFPDLYHQQGVFVWFPVWLRDMDVFVNVLKWRSMSSRQVAYHHPKISVSWVGSWLLGPFQTKDMICPRSDRGAYIFNGDSQPKLSFATLVDPKYSSLLGGSSQWVVVPWLLTTGSKRDDPTQVGPKKNIHHPKPSRGSHNLYNQFNNKQYIMYIRGFPKMVVPNNHWFTY